MTKRYAIWDKESPIITPVGEFLTSEEWMERYPVARVPSITIVCQAGDINGGFFGVLSQMKSMYENSGADFSACTTDEEILEVIEAFEDAQNTPSNEPTSEERIAAALEAQNLMAMEDVTTEE